MAINSPIRMEAKPALQITSNNDSSIDRFLSPEYLEKLQKIMYPKRASTGTYLFWEGDSVEKLYYLRSGRVKLRKSTEDGKDLILSILQEGDLVGEFGTGDSTHSFSAEVIEHAEIGVIQRKDLEILIYRFGEMAIQFMTWMGMMHRNTQSKFRDLLLYGKPGALASTLIRMSNTFGVETAAGIRIDLKLTNTEIAELIGTTREGVNRMLNGLKEEGTIDMDNGVIIIRQIEKLRQTCHCPTYPACPKEICRI